MKRAGHRLICFMLSFMLMISPAGNLSLEGGISSAFRTYAAELSAASDGDNGVSDSLSEFALDERRTVDFLLDREPLTVVHRARVLRL